MYDRILNEPIESLMNY